jgi:dephospho-CoA kinase
LLKVGLTGGIASGKSVVGEMFVALGAHLIQADAIAHELMQPGEAVYREVVRFSAKEFSILMAASIARGWQRLRLARLAKTKFPAFMS